MYTIFNRTSITLSNRTRALWRHFVIALIALAICDSAYPFQESPGGGLWPSAVRDADTFLKTDQRGREVLGMLHAGAAYKGHELVNILPVIDGRGVPVEGEFALVYRFKWEDDGITDLAFLCDKNGQIRHVQVMYTNAQWSPPFAFANLSIKFVGNLLIEEYKNKMTETQRKVVQWFVDNADAKGLLEWQLAFEQ